MTHDPTRDCEHGRLKGKCDVCDLQAEVVRLIDENQRLRAELKFTTPPAPQPVPVKTYSDGKPWPVAPKPWVWLTKEDVESWDLPVNPTVFEFVQFIEAKLREKNGGAA
jgi:hypothetical protein